MSTDTAPAEQPRKRGERTDSSIRKLPNGKGWRARPTLGTDPVTGKAGSAEQGIRDEKGCPGLGYRAAPTVEHRDVGTEVKSDVRRGRRPLADASRGRHVDRAEYRSG